MNITSIKATNMELTPAIRSYVEEKVGSLDKLVESAEPAVEMSVEVGKSTNHHNKGPHMRCEMNLTIPGGMLRAESETEDLYEAIDLAKDDLKRQLVALKERRQETHRGQRPDKE